MRIRVRHGSLAWFAALCLSVAATGVVHANMDTSTAAESGQLRVPDPARARVTSLGFSPVVADYYWIQALGLVGGAAGAVEDHADVIGDLVELVTALDPWVDHPYRFGAVWLTRGVDEVQRANAILARGISYHPSDWRNRFYLGYNHFFYLHDNQRAADVLEPAVTMAGSPRYLGAFVTRLRADGGDLETAAMYLSELIRGTEDEYARAQYLKAYDEVETERRARYLDAARVEFWERNGRDIRSPSELWEGKTPIVRVAPPPHPHFPGFAWVIDPESSEIVSSFYGSRYRLHFHSMDHRRRERWRSQLEDETDRIEGAELEEVRPEGSV